MLVKPNDGRAKKGAIGTISRLWKDNDGVDFLSLIWDKKINDKYNNESDKTVYYTRRFKLFNPDWDEAENEN